MRKFPVDFLVTTTWLINWPHSLLSTLQAYIYLLYFEISVRGKEYYTNYAFLFSRKKIQLIHIVFPYLLPQKLAKFTEGKRQLFRRLLAHGLLCRCYDVQLKGTDGSLYNFSGFVSLTGRDISTDWRKFIMCKAVRTSIAYCNCILYTFT